MLKEDLQQLVELRKKCGFLFCSMEEFVLKYGAICTLQNKPSKYKMGYPKLCFANSMRMVLKSSRLRYVEGYAALSNISLPIHHAWCVDNKNNVIDITSLNFVEYIGVIFKTSFVKEYYRIVAKKNDCCSIIDNWKDDYPLLKYSETILKDIIEL